MTNNDVNIIRDYIKCSQYIQASFNLFREFQFCLSDIFLHFTLNTNDKVVRNKNIDFKEADYFAINALTTNYISSAKMLVDFTEKWIGDAMGAEAKKDFKERISKIYDKNFSYRLLINLRNYCHHGYMPVRIDYDGKCYFDLNQILNTPLFDVKDSFAEEIKKIKQEIHDKFQDDWPRIIYTRTLAEFQLCVITVYLDFITTIKPHLQKLRHNFDEILAHNPKDMGLIRDEATEIIVYHSPKDKAIYISPGTKTMKMIDDIEKTVKDRNKSAKKEFERAFKNAKFIASPNPPLS